MIDSVIFDMDGLKRLFRLCVQRLDDSIRVAVFPVEAAQHRPHGVSRRAAGGKGVSGTAAQKARAGRNSDMAGRAAHPHGGGFLQPDGVYPASFGRLGSDPLF